MKKHQSFIIVFFFTILCYTQEKLTVSYTKTPLTEVIKDLELKTNILFSYGQDLVTAKTVTISKRDITIDNLLPLLTTQTGLIFEKLSPQQIIITKRKNICGYVFDAISKEALPFATVIINADRTTITDDNGYFNFEDINAKTETIRISYIGYNEEEFLIETGQACKNINITPLASALDEVVILGYITTGIDRNKDGSIDVNTKNLGILPGLLSSDIAQSIQLIPGISTLDESATGIQIRGGSPDQNLILYDGIKLYNSGYFYGMFSLFNPFATQSAKIFRSGTSASYGDRISGIIDISSGDQIPQKTEGGFEIDGLAVNGYVKTPLSNKVALYAFARRSYPNIWETPTYDSYVDKIFTNFGVARDINGNVLELETDDDFSPETSNHEFAFSDLSTKFIFKPNSKNSITVSGLYTRNRLDFDFMGGDELVIDSLITQNKGLSAKWIHKTNEKRQEEITAYYSEYNSFYQNEELKDEIGDDGILDLEEINTRENDIVDIGINLSSTTQISEQQKLTLGYQLSHTDLNVTISKEKPLEPEENESSKQDNDNLKNALFGEYTFYFKNRGLINAGLRFVHYNSLGDILVEPRINFEYPLTDRFRIKTAVERRNQPISQLVEFNHTELRLENNLWRLSDDKQFPLLSSNQISGGLLYKHRGFNIDVDAYYKELKGLTTLTSGFSNPLDNLEVGKSSIKGLDVLLKYKWKNYKIWAGYTYNDITFQFPNLKDTAFKFPGNNDVTHQFRISNTLKLKDWQFSLGWQIRTGKPFTSVNSFEIKTDADNEPAGVVNFGAINNSKLPDFHRLDTSVLYDFHIKTGGKKLKAQLGVSALNIYNRIKPVNIVYKAEVKPLDDGGIPKPGTTGATADEREVILEQVIQRFSLGFTPNAVFRVYL